MGRKATLVTMTQATSKSQTMTLDHGTLGKLQGLRLSNGALQFRNIRYATIAGRWQHSKVAPRLGALQGGVYPYNATQHGPIAPQLVDSISFDNNLIQKALPQKAVPEQDEYGCLNLVVTVPDTETKDLPVVVL